MESLLENQQWEGGGNNILIQAADNRVAKRMHVVLGSKARMEQWIAIIVRASWSWM